jgi:hypothetical protein
MRRTFLALLALCTLFSCSSDDAAETTVVGSTSATNDTDPSTPPVASDSPETSGPGGGNASGDVDCALLTSPQLVDGLVGLQIIPQLTSVDLVEQMRSADGVLKYDAEVLDRYLAAVQPLANHETRSFGTPAESIALLTAGATAARQLIESPEPVTQTQIDEMQKVVGPVDQWLAAQLPIGQAIEEVCRT